MLRVKNPKEAVQAAFDRMLKEDEVRRHARIQAEERTEAEFLKERRLDSARQSDARFREFTAKIKEKTEKQAKKKLPLPEEAILRLKQIEKPTMFAVEVERLYREGQFHPRPSTMTGALRVAVTVTDKPWKPEYLQSYLARHQQRKK